MHVFLNVTGDVEIDDVLDVRDVEATCSYCRGNQQRGVTSLETVQRSFTIGLASVTMDTSNRVTLGRIKMVKSIIFLKNCTLA